MIRKFIDNDLDSVMEIWLTANINSHHFISKDYWLANFEMVKGMLPLAEVYVYENNAGQIEGFIGLTDNYYIAGIFVKETAQSHGIGKQLLDCVKGFKQRLRLDVYLKNERAISFYQRELFTIKTETVDDATGEKEYSMVWKKPGMSDLLP